MMTCISDLDKFIIATNLHRCSGKEEVRVVKHTNPTDQPMELTARMIGTVINVDQNDMHYSSVQLS